MAFDLAGTISQSLGSVPQAMLQQQQQQRVQGDLQRIMQAVLPDKKRAAQERLDRLKSKADDIGRRMERGQFAPIGMEELGTEDEVAASQAARGGLETDLARALRDVQTPEGMELGMNLFERAQQQGAERDLAQQEALYDQQSAIREAELGMQETAFEEQARGQRQMLVDQQQALLKRQDPARQREAEKDRLSILRKNQQMLNTEIGNLLGDYDRGEADELTSMFSAVMQGEGGTETAEEADIKLETAAERMRAIAEDPNAKPKRRQKAKDDLKRLGQLRNRVDSLISRGLKLHGYEPRGSGKSSGFYSTPESGGMTRYTMDPETRKLQRKE